MILLRGKPFGNHAMRRVLITLRQGGHVYRNNFNIAMHSARTELAIQDLPWSRTRGGRPFIARCNSTRLLGDVEALSPICSCEIAFLVGLYYAIAKVPNGSARPDKSVRQVLSIRS